MRTQPFIDGQAKAAGDEEARLWRELAQDRTATAREQLFALHARFARSVGRRLARERSYGDIDLADVDQAAYAGLMQALDRFDPDRGTPFRSFAAGRVSGAVIDAITKMSEMREQISWRHRVRSERVKSLQPHGADTLATEQALEALVELAVGLAVGFMLEGTALYRADNAAVASNAYESLAWKDLRGALRSCLELLPERERSILARHYFDGMAFDQIARLNNLSKGRISQLHRSALDRLRKVLRHHGHLKL